MRRRVAVGLVALAVLLVASELALPRLAENRVRGELAADGRVLDVEVDAFPALKLLAGRADSVRVRLGQMTLGNGRLADLLARARKAGELDVEAEVVRVGPLVARDLRLDKEGNRLRAEAGVTDADLRAALPAELGLRPVESGTDGLVLEATLAGIAIRARLSARDGALVIAPDGLLAGFASLTLFSDARVLVTGVGARPRPDGFTVTADGRLPSA